MAGRHRLASLEMGGQPIMRDDYEERMGAQGMESSAGTVSAAAYTQAAYEALPVTCFLLSANCYLLSASCYL